MKYLVSKRKQGGKKKYEQFFATEEGNAGCLDHSGLSDLRSRSERIYYPYEFIQRGSSRSCTAVKLWSRTDRG